MAVRVYKLRRFNSAVDDADDEATIYFALAVFLVSRGGGTAGLPMAPGQASKRFRYHGRVYECRKLNERSLRNSSSSVTRGNLVRG